MARSRRSPSTSRNKASSAKALAGTAGQRRLAALERRRKALASRIAREQKEIASFEDGCRALGAMIVPRLQPLITRGQAADVEIHAMFQQIFTTRKLGKRSYKAILGVYHSLQEIGLISVSVFGRGDDDVPLDEAGDFMGEAESGAQDEWRIPSPGLSGDAAARRSSIRDMFLQLASQVHPDHVTDAEQQRERTEIMKELNRAYRDGDVARLLEMERELDDRGTVELRGEGSTEDRCVRLEEQLRLLQEQLDALGDHLASLRNSFLGELVGEYRRLLKKRVPDPVGILLQELEAEIEAEIAGIEEVANFVREFRDGKMTIKRFIEGPAHDDSFLSEEELFEMVEDGDLDTLLDILARAQRRM